MTNANASHRHYNANVVGARSIREAVDYAIAVRDFEFQRRIAEWFETECSSERRNPSSISDAFEYENLRSAVESALDICDPEYSDGVNAVILFYHPDKENEVTAALSRCVISPTDGLPLVAAYHRGEYIGLPVTRAPLPEMKSVSIGIMLDNPSKPVIEFHERFLAEVDIYERSRQKYGIPRLSERLVCESILPYFGEYEDCRFEPNGRARFPDFRITLSSGEVWALEVTEVAPKRDVLNANQPAETGVELLNPVADRADAFKAELSRLLDKKAQKSPQTDGMKYCLGIYAPIEWDLAPGSDVWDGQDLSAFDAVAVVRIYKAVSFVKGEPAAPALFESDAEFDAFMASVVRERA